jgi:acyl-CoA synthetase (AMP-forming)/AMP-acid ligase II
MMPILRQAPQILTWPKTRANPRFCPNGRERELRPVPYDNVGSSVHRTCVTRGQPLAGFKTPKRWFIQNDALPRTATGKVQKFLLVEKYAQSTF